MAEKYRRRCPQRRILTQRIIRAIHVSIRSVTSSPERPVRQNVYEEESIVQMAQRRPLVSQCSQNFYPPPCLTYETWQTLHTEVLDIRVVRILSPVWCTPPLTFYSLTRRSLPAMEPAVPQIPYLWAHENPRETVVKSLPTTCFL
jgi:hypothetical protein